MQIAFWKWEGAGNDFILVDGRQMPRALHPDEVTRLCDRHHGIGADGLIVLTPLALESGEEPAAGVGDWPRWEMDYCNADGTRSFCGNGSRASFAFLVRQGWAPRRATLVACDGAHEAVWDASRDLPGVALQPMGGARHLGAAPESVTVAPADHWFADSGSPHHVAFLGTDREMLAAVDVRATGAAIRHHAVHAPAGANVNFVADSASDVTELWARTFERGVEDETRACGTGATAIAVADYMRRGGPTFRRIHMPGGTLEVTFDHDPEGFDGIWLHGPAREAFTGVVEWPDKPERPSPNTDVFAWLGVWVALLLGWSLPVQAQPVLTDQAQISLLTGSPGTELWSAWGHTALRVYDPGRTPAIDYVYNYGTFAFGPGFYTRFLRGHLDYRLSRDPFGSFQISYLRSGRGLLEQPLDLAPEDVRAVAEYLEWNLLPENRTYRYQFFKDNCATRVLTVMEDVFGERWDAGCIAAPGPAGGHTYRAAVRPYLQGWPWAAAGVEWALGPEADSGPACFACFLPDGLADQIQRARLDGAPIAAPPLERVPREGAWFSQGPPTPLHPTAAAVAWLLLTLLTLRGGRWTWLGRSIFLLTGLVGLLLAAAWVFTDHRDLWANATLLWANPTLLVLYVPRWFNARWGAGLRAVLFVFLGSFVAMKAVSGWDVPVWMAALLLAVALALEPWKLRQTLQR